MAFIALEGIDGCGKTTQVELLRDWILREYGRGALIIRNPGTTPLGDRVREIIKDQSVPLTARSAALLFAAVRSDLAAVIRKCSHESVDVIVDRWSMSAMAYQGLEVRADRLRQLQEFVGLHPDLTILIDIPVDVAMKRLAARDASNKGAEFNPRFEQREYLENVAVKYRHAFVIEQGKCVRIDGDLSKDDVHDGIASQVRELFSSLGVKEISETGAAG